MLLTVVFFFESELLYLRVQCVEISVSMKVVYHNTSSVTKGARLETEIGLKVITQEYY